MNYEQTRILLKCLYFPQGIIGIMGDEIGGPQRASPPFDDAVHPSTILGKMTLPISGHSRKRADHDPHGRAVPPSPTLHLGVMAPPLTTG